MLHSRFKVGISIFSVSLVSICQIIIQVGQMLAPTEKPNSSCPPSPAPLRDSPPVKVNLSSMSSVCLRDSFQMDMSKNTRGILTGGQNHDSLLLTWSSGSALFSDVLPLPRYGISEAEPSHHLWQRLILAASIHDRVLWILTKSS